MKKLQQRSDVRVTPGASPDLAAAIFAAKVFLAAAIASTSIAADSSAGLALAIQPRRSVGPGQGPVASPVTAQLTGGPVVEVIDENAPWPAPVPGFVPPGPGEHPRLFFRKADLAEIKRRAETPEGRAIVARLRTLLGGGEQMPTHYNTNPPVGQNAKGPDQLPEGAYTISHAAGFGMLFQLTGNRKYADLGRQCFEKAFEGVPDRDERYGWSQPGGALRAGPSLGWYAVGYDLCYDGWDPAFREKVAKELITYNKGPHMSIEEMAAGKRHGPGSNHWGPQIAGPAMALLAVMGDPGADPKKVADLLAVSEKSFLRQLTEGWGDHGWFAEGDGPGTISSDTALVPALIAWRTAAGKDFITRRPNAQWMTMKWVMLTLPTEGKPAFPLRGVYGHNVYARNGMSGSGTFAQGFGAVTEPQKPALLWLYNHVFKAADDAAGRPCDTVSPYPGRAILALVNWPFGMAERNPAEVLPKAVQDKAMGFYMFRNRWQDQDDIIVTALLKNTKGNYEVKGGPIMVWGLGRQTTFPLELKGQAVYFRATATGGVVSTADTSFAVDFSGASGADALLVMAGPAKPVKGAAAVSTLTAAGRQFTIMTLQRGAAPSPQADGDKITVGSQTITLDGGNIVLAK